MATQILNTKLFIPPAGPGVISRPFLMEGLNNGLQRKLTLISAPAGFGKTTLVSEWISLSKRPTAWLSLDKGDNDPLRFLTYLTAALQTIKPEIGKGITAMLQSPQPPPIDSILTTLVNEITTVTDNFILVLDDYHIIDSAPVDNALIFLVEHLPPQMHLVIATREDPDLPLGRLRGRGQMSELRAADLRFSTSEAAGFLNQVMKLNLSEENISALEKRTEGWIAGLQLAAISMQGNKDVSSFIKSFTGSHHFVMDYLVEEVLQQQSDLIQTFLLRTSILERLCGSLCDALLSDINISGQETLEYLVQANMFIIPLDSERHWYRYHHLFGDLLRQRLQQIIHSKNYVENIDADELHKLASQWYEDNGLEIEAFHHAAAANDIDRAIRLIEGKGMPLQFKGALAPILNWLESMATAVFNKNPSLWITYASVQLATGQTSGIEEKLQAAETALEGVEQDVTIRDLMGRIAATRAMVALSQHDADTIISQSQRALEYLSPDNISFHTSTIWKMGYAYELQGDRAAAKKAYSETRSTSQSSGNTIFYILGSIGVGNMEEAENHLFPAAEIYRHVLELVGNIPFPITIEAHLGLARIFYQWNDLDSAEQHWQQSVSLAKQLPDTDRTIACEVFLARLKFAKGEVVEASAILTRAGQSAQKHNFTLQIPEVAAAQVLVLLHQGNLDRAAHVAKTHELTISTARVHIAQGDTSSAKLILEKLHHQMATKGWYREQLEVMILETLALHNHGDTDNAFELLSETLALAEPGGFIRIFVDEGIPMAKLLSDAADNGIMSEYTKKLQSVFESIDANSRNSPNQPLIEPLSDRELEILELIALGFSNHDICQKLSLALSTVKGHNRNIFEKLQVQRRTEAVALARKLGLL